MSSGQIWTPDVVNCIGCKKRMDLAAPGTAYTTLENVKGRPNVCMECYQVGVALMTVLGAVFRQEGGQIDIEQVREFARSIARRGGA